MSAGMVSLRMPPTFMPATPTSQPLMTIPCPNWNSKGWPEFLDESNWVPSVSHPV